MPGEFRQNVVYRPAYSPRLCRIIAPGYLGTCALTLGLATLSVGSLNVFLCAQAWPTESLTVTDGPVYFDMCDASAAVALGNQGFMVANDEDNVLRVYARDQGGRASTAIDLNSFLRPDPEHPETDIEGATWLGDKVFWITSHGKNKDAKLRLSRYRVFATEFVKVDGRTRVRGTGVAYKFLHDDLREDQRLSKYRFAAAMLNAPKDDFALNIEGLSATPDGQLLIGFRNPVPNGLALLIPVVNPEQVIRGRVARFGPAVELELGGLGIRSIEYHAPWKQYIILAGPKDSGSVQLFLWSGDATEKPQHIDQVDFGKQRPEAFVCYRDETETVLQTFSDDGTRKIDGDECKKLEDAARRHFRSIFVRGLR